VVFDAPIGDAAGLKITDVDPFQTGTARIALIDCDYDELEARAVTSEN
jgi:hypothetical protein